MLHFVKMHGLGNDFVIVDARREEIPSESLAELAIRICDRHFGVGADGLVILRPHTTADVFMQIINADGSEAEMCGNAIRCVARLLYEEGGPAELQVATLAGIMQPRVQVEGGRVTGVRVDMGEPRLARSHIPMLGPEAPRVLDEPLRVEGQEFRVTCVSMGNPHCLIFEEEGNEYDLAYWGPRIENHPAFPQRTNVEFVTLRDRDEIRVRVWERGAGPTLACGTGACAAAVGSHLKGLTGRKVRVHLPGGVLLIEWADNNHVFMTGPATFVFRGELDTAELLTDPA